MKITHLKVSKSVDPETFIPQIHFQGTVDIELIDDIKRPRRGDVSDMGEQFGELIRKAILEMVGKS